MTDSASSLSFAQLLRRYRRAAGLTQEELAERAGLSARAVSDLERGENRIPRRDTLDLLADALHLSAEERGALDGTIQRTRAPMSPSTPGQVPTFEGEPTRPDTLPAQPTPFIGREREVEAVRARLLDPETRLLTLTGPGGVGKTRLALQAAAAARPAFADGVAFVTLAALSDPDLVLPTIARAVGVGDEAGRPLADTLAAVLRGKRLLLVLDNCEQVLPAADAVQVLLLAAPGVKALATSRAALRVRGERLHPVEPLAVPRPPLPPLEALSQYDAVALFIARAQDADPGFAVTNATAPAVAEICARLDGLPLAIELTAARVRLLAPEALLARLSSRLKVATGGARDLPERQRTLRAAINWSHELLDPGERMLLRRLAVFTGGRTLEAVEAVCNANGDLPREALDGVESLVDKSLLRREDGAGAEGEPRLVMLETVHEYARERLEASGERATTERAHALYYCALAEEAEPRVREENPAWLARLDREHDNLRAALRWAGEGGFAALELRLASALSRFWETRAHWTEGRRHLREALARAPEAATSARACALRGAGFLASAQGDMGEAQRLTEEALAAYRVLGDEQDAASTLSNLSYVAGRRGDYAAAMRYNEEGLEVARRLGDQMAVAGTLNNMGLAVMQGGDLEQAMDLLTESLGLFRALGNRSFVARTLLNQGIVAVFQGDYATAERLLQETFDLLQTLGDTYGLAVMLQSRGLLLLRQGDVDGALVDLRRALDMQREMGAYYEGTESLTWIAWACQEKGQVAWATRLYGAAEALYAQLGVVLDIPSRSLYDDALVRLRLELPAEAYAAAWAAGHALSAEQAFAEALST